MTGFQLNAKRGLGRSTSKPPRLDTFSTLSKDKFSTGPHTSARDGVKTGKAVPLADVEHQWRMLKQPGLISSVIKCCIPSN